MVTRREYRGLRDKFVVHAEEMGVPQSFALNAFPACDKVRAMQGAPKAILKELERELQLKDAARVFKTIEADRRSAEEQAKHNARREAFLAQRTPEERAAADALAQQRMQKKLEKGKSPHLMMRGLSRRLPSVLDGVSASTSEPVAQTGNAKLSTAKPAAKTLS